LNCGAETDTGVGNDKDCCVGGCVSCGGKGCSVGRINDEDCGFVCGWSGREGGCVFCWVMNEEGCFDCGCG